MWYYHFLECLDIFGDLISNALPQAVWSFNRPYALCLPCSPLLRAMLGLLIKPHLFYVVSTCWQAWSFLELIPTWFISCWKFGTHILTLLCAVVNHCRGCMLKKASSITGSAGIRIFAHLLGTILRNLLLMLLLWCLFLLLFEITLCFHFNALFFVTCVNLTLLFIYIILHLDLVVLALLSIWSRKACCSVLVGITSKI